MKRGIFIVLIILFSLFSMSYVVGEHGGAAPDERLMCIIYHGLSTPHSGASDVPYDDYSCSSDRTKCIPDDDRICVRSEMRSYCDGGTGLYCEGGTIREREECTEYQNLNNITCGVDGPEYCGMHNDKAYCLHKKNDGQGCSQHYQCISGYCNSGTCGRVTGDCDDNFSCDPTGHDVSSDRCKRTNNPDRLCASGYYCEPSGTDRCTPKKEAGESCECVYYNECFDIECESGRCRDTPGPGGTCAAGEVDGTTCESHSECASNNCYYGTCRSGSGDGSQCMEDSDCASNNCAGGDDDPGMCLSNNFWIGSCSTFPTLSTCNPTNTSCIIGATTKICGQETFCNVTYMSALEPPYPSIASCVFRGHLGEPCPFSNACHDNFCYNGVCGRTNYTSSCGSGFNCSDDGDMCVSSLDSDVIKICRSDYYCDETSNGCVVKKGASATCSDSIECASGVCNEAGLCAGGLDGIIPCPAACPEGQECNTLTGACVASAGLPEVGGPCTSDSNCTSGKICVEGTCTEPTSCSTRADCLLLGENFTCYTNGGSPVCRLAGTGDEDLDGIPDNEDPCVGSDLDDCTLPGGGMSCGSVSGRICSGSCGPSATLSNISRESNCWVPSTCSCQEAPFYVGALGTSVRFDRQCQPGNTCLSRVTVVNADGSGEVDVNLFSSMGLPQNSNPYTENDASCCGISLDEQTGEGRAVPGYGSIALIITSLILVLYYTKKRYF